MQPVVTLDKVSFGYRRDAPPLFSGVHLEVLPGQAVAITGPSGIGKSSMLNLIAGLALPWQGDVCVGGSAVNRLDEAARTRLRARRLGFVYQGIHLLPFLTVAENIALPLTLIGGQWDSGRVASLLVELGLEPLAERYPAQLSGGEQQRVAIGRALVHRPLAVLADEPTGNLDERTAARVLEVMLEALARHGSALIMVTHSAQAAHCAARRYRLDGGRLHAAQ